MSSQRPRRARSSRRRGTTPPSTAASSSSSSRYERRLPEVPAERAEVVARRRSRDWPLHEAHGGEVQSGQRGADRHDRDRGRDEDQVEDHQVGDPGQEPHRCRVRCEEAAHSYVLFREVGRARVARTRPTVSACQLSRELLPGVDVGLDRGTCVLVAGVLQLPGASRRWPLPGRRTCRTASCGMYCESTPAIAARVGSIASLLMRSVEYG